MKVSVVMPAWNAAATIHLALLSITRQSYRDIETIVVDDGSSDDTAQVVASVGGVTCIRQANMGPSAARNVGIAAAHGKVIGFLDADDVWLPHSVEVALACFTHGENAAVVQGHIRDLWRTGESWRLDKPRLSFNLGSAFFSRAALQQIGGFEPMLRVGEDIDLWIRLTEQGIRRQIIQPVTLLYRRNPNPDPQAGQVYLSRLLHTLKRSVERQRA